MLQEQLYPSELKSLLRNDNVHKSDTLVPLSPTLNNQSLICVGGRVKNTNIFANSNYQAIVSKDHPIAKLIIKHHHEENLHVGREQTLSSLRSMYWISACRGIICSVITPCLYFKREESKQYFLSCLMSQKTDFALMKNHYLLTTQVHTTSNFPREPDLIRPLPKDMQLYLPALLRGQFIWKQLVISLYRCVHTCAKEIHLQKRQSKHDEVRQWDIFCRCLKGVKASHKKY